MPKAPSEQQDQQIIPDANLEKRGRRAFSTEFKMRVVAAADACRHGELGALLRREKLYSSQLQQWRRELLEGGIEGLRKSKPGPASSRSPEQRRIERLEKENARLNSKLSLAEDCIELQKKALSIFERVQAGRKR